MGYLSTDKKKITTKTFAEMKQAGEKVTMLTAYDFTTAGIIDSAGIDSILIGDSASNVMAGNANTLPISVDEMIYHARSVTRAVNHALVVCDMPFGSYQISREEALRNACRMMKETGVDREVAHRCRYSCTRTLGTHPTERQQVWRLWHPCQGGSRG